MFRVSGIIAFQTKKSNLERDLRKETDIKTFSFTETLRVENISLTVSLSSSCKFKSTLNSWWIIEIGKANTGRARAKMSPYRF